MILRADRLLARLRAALLLATGALVLGPASPAAAESATLEEVQALAVEAQTDVAAFDRLLTIDEVDGRPVDLRAALAGASPQEMAGRLEALAGGEQSVTGDAPTDPAADRAAAEEILDGRRYDPVELPRPLRGPLNKLGEWLGNVLEPVGSVLSPIVREPVLIVIAAVVVVAGAVVGSARLARRRSSPGYERSLAARLEQQDDPALLERMAAEAEAAGDRTLAYRLRFRAGVLRLQTIGTVAYRPSMTTQALAELVRSSRFDRLADDFDEVAYGGRPVSAQDLDEARTTWSRVLEEAGRP
jgi:hypothetical protein